MSNARAGLPDRESQVESPDSTLITIRLLGTFSVSVGDRIVEPSAWRLRRATQLVKLLALTPGHRIHRDQLIDALWPETDPDSALSNFHQTLHAARRALEPDRSARSSGSLLRLHQQVLSFEPAGDVWIDAEAFQSAASNARTSSDLDSCIGALALYSGDLLPEDLYENWTQRTRDSLRETYLELLLTTAQLQEASGATDAAIETLRKIIATDPLKEAAYSVLMRLYAMSGRRDQALRLYEQLSETLQAELDASPSPEIIDLSMRIGSGDVAAPAVPATGTGSRAQSELAGGIRISLAELAAESGFVDRQNELSRLQRAFDTMLSGQGQIVLLEGEPGIGKTRLAEEVAHFAGMSGATVFWARCHEADGAPAFWPWYQIVRNSLRDRPLDELMADLGAGAGPIAQVVPDVRDALPDTPVPSDIDSDQARFRFFDSVTTYLGRLSERHPLLLIIDELHWADQSSLVLLEFFADEIASHRIMLVVTYREAEIGDMVPLIRTIARLNRSRSASRLQLSGFEIRDTEQYGRLIAGRPLPENLVQTLYQRTNGNPFFLREVVELLAQEGSDSDRGRWETTIPLGVREAVSLRMSQLSEDSRKVLVNAAVIGGEFQLEVLAAVSGETEDRLIDLLEEAVTLGVIVEDSGAPGRFRFTHILTQETLYEGLIAARRARIHARVGDAIERFYESKSDPPYAEIAHHFYLAASAGESKRAVEYLTRAGEQLTTRLAYAEAASQFRRAVEILEQYMPDLQPELFDVLLMLARAEMAAGESRDARASRLRSVDVARALEDPERLAMAALQMVDIASDYMDWRASDETVLLEESLAALPEGDSPLRVQVMSRLAHTLVFNKTPAESRDFSIQQEQLVQEAVSMARRIGNPGLVADALRAAHDVLWTYEDVDERIAIAREILTLATETHDPQLELAARAQLTGEFLTKGMVDEADRELDAYETLATKYQLPLNIWSATAKRAMRAYMRGELGKSEELIEQAHAIAQRSAPEISQLNHLLQSFFIRREQDRLHEVEEMLTTERVNHPAEPLWQCLLAVLYADSGRHDETSGIMSDLLDQKPSAIPRDSFWLASMALISDACATLNDTKHAADLLDLLRPHASLFVCPGNHVIFLGPVSHYLGRLAMTLERWDDAAGYFDDARMAEKAMGIPIFEAHTESAFVEMCAKRGDERDVLEQLAAKALDISARYDLARLSRLTRAIQERLPTCNSP